MRLDTLKERIENAKAKIEKKQNTITKKEALIEKKSDKVRKMGFDINMTHFTTEESKDAYWLVCDIEYLRNDIERLKDEVEETKKSLEKYEKQLAGELEKEKIILTEIPESMKRMQEELVKGWDEYDIKRRNKIREDRRNMEYVEWGQKYSTNERMHLMYQTDEQIHNDNVQSAKYMILDLYYRVKAITGEVTDWSGIECEMGNMGAVLTGKVIGKEGIATVETILAGGYNIQRLHVRTLVHAW